VGSFQCQLVNIRVYVKEKIVEGDQEVREKTNVDGSDLTLREAQASVDEWIKTIGVRYFSELTNLAQLVEEVGELARIISRTYGEQSFKESDKNSSLKDEMADILFVLICLANQTGVDLTEAFEDNLRKKTRRDGDRHRNNPKLR
jgi:NTP pyrophosphatase (non-canonical NTP hydrolase)